MRHDTTMIPTIERRTDSSGRLDVRVQGELTVRSAAPVRRQLLAAMGEHPALLHVDLTDVTELDAAGIVAITVPMMAARRAGIATTVTSPSGASSRRFAELAGVLPLLSTER